MALEFCTIDGFEWASNATDLRDKYSVYETSGSGSVWTIDTGTVRTGTRSLNGGNGTNYGDFQFPVISTATTGLGIQGIRSVHFGCHFRVNNVGTTWTGVLYNTYTWAVSQQGFLRFNNLGQPVVTRGSTTLATGSIAVSANTWHWLEVYHAIDNASGRWKVEIDGESSIDFTGDTQNGTAQGFLYCRLETPRLAGYEIFIDNLFVRTSASLESDPSFYGPCYVESLYPDADGNYTDWTSTASPTIYTEIDTAQVDTSSPYTYISSSTTSQKISCSHAALTLINPTTDVILCTSLEHHMKKNTAGAGTMKQFVRKGGADYASSTLGVPYEEFERKQHFWENDPSSSPATAWTKSDIDNSEFGIEYTA